MNFMTMIVLLRAIHILGGVIWAGGVIAIAFFVGPTAFAAGDNSVAGLRAMRASQKRIAMWTGIAALLTILAGLGLFAELHAGAAGAGEAVLGLGALAAILSFPVGAVMGAPARRGIAGLLKKLEAESREPSAGEIAIIDGARARGQLAAQATAVCLIAAVICMAIWRYL